jgi:hypothetical protein
MRNSYAPYPWPPPIKLQEQSPPVSEPDRNKSENAETKAEDEVKTAPPSVEGGILPPSSDGREAVFRRDGQLSWRVPFHPTKTPASMDKYI